MPVAISNSYATLNIKTTAKAKNIPYKHTESQLLRIFGRHRAETPRQNVYACARLSISSLFFSNTFQSDQSLPRALGFNSVCSLWFMLLVFLTIL